MTTEEGGEPQPIPDGVPTEWTVSDDERNRYGVMVDHAAERGLLTPAEYMARLAEVAEATSIEELQRIVTELPLFDEPAALARATANRRVQDPADLDAVLSSGLSQPKRRKFRTNPWIILAIMVSVLFIALVVLTVVANHLSHNPSSGVSGFSVISVGLFSRLHP